MSNTSCCIVLTTTDNREVVDSICKTLLEKKLAACVQVDEVESFFCYNSKYEQTKEFRLQVKAKSDNYKQIESLIVAKHNYDLPQIIKIDIVDGLPPYLNWICSN